jgi:hypothetical protein
VLDGFNRARVTIPVTPARSKGHASVVVPEDGLGDGGAAVWCASTRRARVEDDPARAGGWWCLDLQPRRAAAYGARGGALLRLRELFDESGSTRAPQTRFERKPRCAQGGRQPARHFSRL